MNLAPAAYPRLGHAILLTFAVVLLQVLLSIPLTLAGLLLGDEIMKHPGALAVINILAFGLLLAWGVKMNGVPWAPLFYVRPVSWLLVAPVVVASLGLGVLLSEVDNLFRYFFPAPQWAADLMRDLFQARASWWGSLLALVIVAPVTEELFFRGLILRGLLGRYRFGAATVISALLFAIVHLNPWQFLTAFFLGLVFAWYLRESGSIIPCVLGHAVNNGLTLVIGFLPFEIQGFNAEEMPASGTFQPLWFDALGLILTAGGLLWFGKVAQRIEANRREVPPLLDTSSS